MPTDAVFRQRHVGRHPACALAVVVGATMLANCACPGFTVSQLPARGMSTAPKPTPGSIPLPPHALLKPQREPDCEYKSAEPEADDRHKLDYERQCYRHAEIIARNRLDLLQGSVNKTVKAVKRSERAGS